MLRGSGTHRLILVHFGVGNGVLDNIKVGWMCLCTGQEHRLLTAGRLQACLFMQREETAYQELQGGCILHQRQPGHLNRPEPKEREPRVAAGGGGAGTAREAGHRSTADLPRRQGVQLTVCHCDVTNACIWTAAIQLCKLGCI